MQGLGLDPHLPQQDPTQETGILAFRIPWRTGNFHSQACGTWEVGNAEEGDSLLAQIWLKPQSCGILAPFLRLLSHAQPLLFLHLTLTKELGKGAASLLGMY